MSLRINIAQINPTVGLLDKNIELIVDQIAKSTDINTRIVLLPYNAITGNPLKGLCKKTSFINAFHAYLRKLASALLDRNLGGIHVLFVSDNLYGDPRDKCLINISLGKVDFTSIDPKLGYSLFEQEDKKIAVCYAGVSEQILSDQPNIILVSSKCEFVLDKDYNNKNYYKALSKKLKCTVIKANLAGASDEIIFPGASYVVVAGTIQGEALWFDEDNMSVLFDNKYVEVDKNSASRLNIKMSIAEQAYRACLTGLNAYIHKNSFKKVIIGLSGGIDSALVSAMVADCVGGKNVYALSLPSKYSSDHSIEDAKKSVQNNGFNYNIINIDPLIEAYSQIFKVQGLVEENLQSRVRANILMATANELEGLVVANGNKSESATGYFTMYGDSCGGYAPIIDCYKTLVWEMAKWRNEIATEYNQPQPIPSSSINKEPSAELHENQKDTDTLPDYNILDDILQKYIDENLSAIQIADLGHNMDTIKNVLSLITKSEWKRHQYPIGPRITSSYLGIDKNMPITNGWFE